MVASASRAFRLHRVRELIVEAIEARFLLSGEPITFSAVHSDVGPLSAVVTGDFNRDGRVDLVARRQDGGKLQLSLGLGNGRFSPPTNLSAIDAGPNVVALAAGDFNRDGALDLAACNGTSSVNAGGDVRVLYGVGNGSFRPAQVHRAGPQPTAVAGGDVNGDGALDLLVSNDGLWPAVSPLAPQAYGGGLLLGGPDGFAPVKQVPLPVPTTAVAVSAAVSARVAPVRSIAFAGPLHTAASPLPQTLVMILPAAHALVDVAASTSAFSQTVLPGVNRGIVIAPLNGDRAPDVAALQVLGNASHPDAASVYTVVSRPSLTDAIRPAQYAAMGPFATGLGIGVGIAAADFDRDDVADIAVAGARPLGALLPALQGGVSVLKGRGDGTLTRLGFFATGRIPAALAAADVNRDGRPDLVTTNSGGITALVNRPLSTPVTTTAAAALLEEARRAT